LMATCTTRMPCVRAPVLWLKERLARLPEADEDASSTSVQPASEVGAGVGETLKLGLRVGVSVTLGVALWLADSVGLMLRLGLGVAE